MRCPGCNAATGSGAEFCPACLALISSPTTSDVLDLRPGLVTARALSDSNIYFASGTALAGRYRIVRHLGSGGMGVVYQADDLKLQVPVALKFLNRASAGDDRRLELFLNEVRLARQITHPNVCRIFDVGEVDGQHFLSMEHVEGEDLASLLRRIGRLPKDKALSIALEICLGLQAAHERGILHGDLKPSNLMIDAHGRAKIMDFGLAKLSRVLPHRSVVAGTPDYMAPEQRRGRSSSVHTEVYALGLVLYELFTGRRARGDFDLDSDSADFLAPSDVPAVLDPILERIILHCLERDPGLRPSSVSAVATSLNRLMQPAWRPAEGLAIPHRSHWVLRRKLGQGGFGETWLAEHVKTRDLRVFKFCSDVAKLKAFQREITLFRFMRETLGGRSDIAAILDWQLDEPPYFIESEFAASANLLEWFEKEGRTGKVSFQDRIEVIRKTAVAVAAAHSVGILHKDVKPANVLVGREVEGAVKVRLCDFGVSVLTDEARLRSAGVTSVGLTAPDPPSPDAGTRLYMAPEVIEGKAPTTAADVYALGVMLYQVTAGDFAKALAPGWDRDIDDELVREDIAASVEGSPDRRVSAAQLAERLRQLPDRAAARNAELESRQRARAVEASVRRRRSWATAVLAALLLLSVGLGVAFERAETSARQALIDRTLRSNEAMVRLAAAAVSDKLQDAVQRVEEEATNQTLRELLGRLAAARDERAHAAVREAVRRPLDQALVRNRPLIQSWTVADAAGYLWSRAPYDPAIVGQNYKYREWFNGKVELRRDAAIAAAPRGATGFSLAFRSTALDQPLMIGLASPIFAPGERAPGGRIVGVLNAGIQLKTFNRWLETAENLPGDGACPDQFVLLLHRTQLIRHPCPAPAASVLPVMEFSNLPAVNSLLSATGRRTANFRDPLRGSERTPSSPALAVAWSLENLPEWTLILEQDVNVALKPITALTAEFHGPAHLAFGLGAAAFVPLIWLLWWGGRARRITDRSGSSSTGPS